MRPPYPAAAAIGFDKTPVLRQTADSGSEVGKLRREHRTFALGIAIALALYSIWGALLIAQRPGLQNDEALLVMASVSMNNPTAAVIPHEQDYRWACAGHHCLPLMSADYIGALKAYLVLPFLALHGPSVVSIRIVSLLLGVVGIWGTSRLVVEQFGAATGVATGLVLAFSPSYLTMVVFDNSAIGVLMAGTGLACAFLARYLRRNDVVSALLLGLTLGLGIWARANFLWTIAAGAAAVALAAGRRILIPARHAAAFTGGAILGGMPFLMFQVFSRGATWKDQNVFVAHEPVVQLMHRRLFEFSEMIFQEAEHRAMWNAVMRLPVWQLRLFSAIVLASACYCLVPRSGERQRYRSRLAFGLAFFALATILFTSRMAVFEHHLIALLPFAAVIVALACGALCRSQRVGRPLVAILAVVYFASAIQANLQTIQGLHRTGGLGFWSDAAQTLAADLDREHSDLPLKIVDWGFRNSLYVMTNGRVGGDEIFWGATAERSGIGLTWAEEIRKGGRFLVPGPRNRAFSAVVDGFERAVGDAHAETREWAVRERDGKVFARVIEIEPSAREPEESLTIGALRK